MPSNIPLRVVKRKPARLGCAVQQQKKKPTHWKVTRMVDGVKCASGFATTDGARYVKSCYRDQLCDQLHISDEEWDAA